MYFETASHTICWLKSSFWGISIFFNIFSIKEKKQAMISLQGMADKAELLFFYKNMYFRRWMRCFKFEIRFLLKSLYENAINRNWHGCHSKKKRACKKGKINILRLGSTSMSLTWASHAHGEKIKNNKIINEQPAFRSHSQSWPCFSLFLTPFDHVNALPKHALADQNTQQFRHSWMNLY